MVESFGVKVSTVTSRHRADTPQIIENRAHQNVVIVALANKLVRMVWAVLGKNERYRAPVLAVTT